MSPGRQRWCRCTGGRAEEGRWHWLIAKFQKVKCKEVGNAIGPIGLNGKGLLRGQRGTFLLSTMMLSDSARQNGMVTKAIIKVICTALSGWLGGRVGLGDESMNL